MAKYKKTVRNGIEYWYCTKTLGRKVNENGVLVPVRNTFYGKTQKELEEKVNAALERFSKCGEAKPQYFSILFEMWINDFFLSDASLSAGTKSTYIRNWEKYKEFADFYIMPIDLVVPRMIQMFYNELFYEHNASPSSIRKIHNLFRRFYAYASLNGLAEDRTACLRVPRDKFDIVKADSDVVIWEDEELEKILSGFDSVRDDFRLRFLIVLLMNTGLRIGEALGVSSNDIDEEGLHVRRQVQEEGVLPDGSISNVPVIMNVKTPKARRVVPLNEDVRSELKRHLAWQVKDSKRYGYGKAISDGRLFTTKFGNYYDKKNVRRALDRYYDSVGVPRKGPHTYRHTFGTKLCRNGVGIEVVASLMGHESIETTAKYYVNVDNARKAAAVARLYREDVKCLE